MPACTFFGHRDCPSSIRPRLRETLVDLIENHAVDTFCVGQQGVFDAMVRSVLKELILEYLAAQVCNNDLSLLSHNITVRYLIELAGDVHHIFPKEYLKANHFGRNLYNQNANYAYLDTQVNKSIGKKAPHEYLGAAVQQCETKQISCGSITDIDLLRHNLEANCIPFETCSMDYTSYEEFLVERRKRMAKKIRDYYESL